MAPSSTRNRTRQQSVTASEALEALQQLKAAEAQFKQGDYAAALTSYTAVVKGHPDLALTEYARLGQALCMYQVWAASILAAAAAGSGWRGPVQACLNRADMRTHVILWVL